MTPTIIPTIVPAKAPGLRAFGGVASDAAFDPPLSDGEEAPAAVGVCETEVCDDTDCVDTDAVADLLEARQLVSCPLSTKNGEEAADIPALPSVSNATATYVPLGTSTVFHKICWAFAGMASVSVRDTSVVPFEGATD